jgi:dolichyl-diphosphooligosaccharide--protein glycosyltransferase
MEKPKTLSANRLVFLLTFICILIVYGISCYKRQADYQYWMEHSQDYVVDHVTAMTTMDAYYWLKMARELDEGSLAKGKPDPLRGYPDHVPLVLSGSPSLLAEFIRFGKNFTGGDYYRAGLMLVSVLAGLFVFPLFFYFNRLGFGGAAVLGGLVGSFSHAYYDRSMMGRVDTDLLNIFFPLAIACFILPMDREKTWRANSFLAIGAGITMYLFNWWYQQPSFILVFLFLMTAYLLLGRVNWKQILLILFLFLLLSGPDYVLQSMTSLRTFLHLYIPIAHAAQHNPIVWPDIMKTIGEAQNRSIEVTLNMLHGFWPLDFAGFAGLLYLYIRRFRQMILVSPLILLGIWGMAGSARFMMYLSPLIGVGAGVLIEVLTRFAGRKMRLHSLLVSGISISLMFVLFFSTTAYTSFSLNTAPSISAQTTRAILDIKKIVPKNSAMFTPFWEHSYALMEIGDFATYHDGGLHGGMRSTLTAMAMTSTQQKEMVSLISFLEDYGFNYLYSLINKENISAAEMLKLVFSYPKGFRGENVYVLYLEPTIWKFTGMSKIGTWDFEQKKSTPMAYVELHCFSVSNNTIKCSDGSIYLDKGLMDDGSRYIPLKGVLFVNNGYVVDQRYYQNEDGYYLQVLMKNNKAYMTLVADEQLFRTNFNQQYLLGNYDRRYFEEVYNNFPVARVLKVKKAAAAGPDN